MSSMSLNTEGQCETTVRETPPPPAPAAHTRSTATMHTYTKQMHTKKLKNTNPARDYPQRKRVKTRMRNEGIKRWREEEEEEEEDVPWSHLLDYG